MEQNTLEVTERSEVFEFTSIKELVNQALPKEISEHITKGGLSTGFKMLDKVTGGFQNGQLFTVAVKPGMGKTAFLLSIANNLSIKNNYSVAIFSAERSSQKITNRIIETETGMSIEKLRAGAMKASERDHIHSLISSITKAKLFLDDTPSLSAEELVKKSRHLKANQQADLIIIDYLELLTTSITDSDSRPEQLKKIMAVIKELSRELNLPVLLFSQISSPLSFLQKPEISNLPDYLLELSDSIMVLHRSDLLPAGQNGNGKGKVEVIVAKQPYVSEPETVSLTYIESIAKFADFS
jgi:replicative DNA helicase